MIVARGCAENENTPLLLQKDECCHPYTVRKDTMPEVKPSKKGTTTNMTGPSPHEADAKSSPSSASWSLVSSCLPPSDLSREEWRNLLILVSCYTCVATSTTLIVGGSAVAVLSVGGDAGLAPVALSSFFAGSALASPAAAPLFERLGRRGGFVSGSIAGVIGGAIGCVAIVMSSPALVVASAFPIGLSNGVGQHLRFAAMEVLAIDGAREFAMTTTLTGGCIAAFLGPESQGATRDVFGDDLTYLGLFVMIALFNALCIFLVSLVRFPVKAYLDKSKDEGDNERFSNEAPAEHGPMMSLVLRDGFLTSSALATLSWSIMAMPMSVVRIAMADGGYTKRLGLSTLELHFLGMFSPGFVSGSLIRSQGTGRMGWLGLALFISALVCNILAREEEEGTAAPWMIGLVLLGVGWNVTFASATVMLSKTYKDTPADATRIQAANDCVMFGITGALVVSTGYIYQAGGSGMEGWKLVNYVVFALVLVMFSILLKIALGLLKEHPVASDPATLKKNSDSFELPEMELTNEVP